MRCMRSIFVLKECVLAQLAKENQRSCGVAILQLYDIIMGHGATSRTVTIQLIPCWTAPGGASGWRGRTLQACAGRAASRHFPRGRRPSSRRRHHSHHRRREWDCPIIQRVSSGGVRRGSRLGIRTKNLAAAAAAAAAAAGAAEVRAADVRHEHVSRVPGVDAAAFRRFGWGGARAGVRGEREGASNVDSTWC